MGEVMTNRLPEPCPHCGLPHLLPQHLTRVEDIEETSAQVVKRAREETDRTARRGTAAVMLPLTIVTGILVMLDVPFLVTFVVQWVVVGAAFEWWWRRQQRRGAK